MASKAEAEVLTRQLPLNMLLNELLHAAQAFACHQVTCEKCRESDECSEADKYHTLIWQEKMKVLKFADDPTDPEGL